MSNKNWDSDSLRTFFKIYDIRCKEAARDLQINEPLINRMLYEFNFVFDKYNGLLDAYYYAKVKSKIEYHNEMIEYYKSLKL